MNPLLIAAVVVLIIAVVLIKIFLPEVFSEKEVSKNGSIYTHKRKDFLMSRAEHEFFNVLVGAVENRYYIFPQVHLPTILDHKIPGQNWKGAFRHIDEKSVDFVICDKAYIKPLLVIELDDQTHEREDRKERDVEVGRILNDSGLPLLRFDNHGHFDMEEVKRLVLDKLD